MINARVMRRHIIAVADRLDLPLTMQQAGSLANWIAASATRGSHPDFNLTDQQHAVLVGLASGEDAQATADRIRRSLDIVKTHRRLLYTALGAKTGAQAVAIAIDLGLLNLNAQAPARAGGDN
ncbi:hypothetical protein [Streptomyces chartreusis]|uniref:hypothetical protein n=1 Tax=Streptomyces chartreusis TaxID=1969 RepID=UPI002E18C94D